MNLLEFLEKLLKEYFIGFFEGPERSFGEISSRISRGLPGETLRMIHLAIFLEVFLKEFLKKTLDESLYDFLYNFLWLKLLEESLKEF